MAALTTDQMTPPPGTIRLFSEVMCGWAMIALHRIHRARAAAGLEDEPVRRAAGGA